MKETVRLGHLAGVRIGLNWSVLVVLALIVLGLSAGRFPLEHPDRSTSAYVLAGLVAGVVFLASLLAHELSHAVVARRNGVEVEGIVLWMLGGVAQLRGRAPTPGAELRISAVGPLVSLGLAGAFGVLLLAVRAGGATGLTESLLSWLALINLVLAVFNLFPAAPLDGGRILTAVLWERRGDRFTAAVTAARAGRAFGIVLVVLGVVDVVLGAGGGGLWLVLVGGFLTMVASAEEQQAQVEAVLEQVRVRDVMTPDPVVAPADLTVAELIEDYVFRHRFSSFPLIAEGGRPVGLVTLNRVKQVPPGERSRTPVWDVACTGDDLVLLSPDEPMIGALHRLSACADGRAVVTTGGAVVGVVSPSDVYRHLQRTRLRAEGGTAYPR